MMWARNIPSWQRPAILNRTHEDWVFFLRWIPRSWFAWYGNPPRRLAGNAKSLKPIPDPGEWLIAWPLYFACTMKSGWHVRVGLRWDDIDHYYQLTFITIKKVF